MRYIPTLHIFFYLAGHPGDDKYDNCARGKENIHTLDSIPKVERSTGDGCGDVTV
jgi:hypothetical protein